MSRRLEHAQTRAKAATAAAAAKPPMAAVLTAAALVGAGVVDAGAAGPEVDAGLTVWPVRVEEPAEAGADDGLPVAVVRELGGSLVSVVVPAAEEGASGEEAGADSLV